MFPRARARISYVLWRTMSKEVPELSGFDPDTLRAKWLQMLYAADPTDAADGEDPFPRDAYLPPGTSAIEAQVSVGGATHPPSI